MIEYALAGIGVLLLVAIAAVCKLAAGPPAGAYLDLETERMHLAAERSASNNMLLYIMRGIRRQMAQVEADRDRLYLELVAERVRAGTGTGTEEVEPTALELGRGAREAEALGKGRALPRRRSSALQTVFGTAGVVGIAASEDQLLDEALGALDPSMGDESTADALVSALRDEGEDGTEDLSPLGLPLRAVEERKQHG